MSIQILYQTLRNEEHLEPAHGEFIHAFHQQCTEAQLGSLACQLYLRRSLNTTEKDILNFIKRAYKNIEYYLQFFSLQETQTHDLPVLHQQLITILQKTYHSQPLTNTELSYLLEGYSQNKIDDTLMAMWLMTVTYTDLSEDNIARMTEIMCHSGKIYHYRDLNELESRKIILRYPTGGVSEKIALLMPSLISAFANYYPIASNFLVAKTLGFTGGTWDKLSSIPGFTFPHQGRQTIDMIKKCHVAMSVTNDQFNPLDNRLYQLRSATGTVLSIPLIITSIASKLCAIPADFLLMDVRYGEGSLAKDKESGTILAKGLMDVLSKKMPTDYCMTELNQPTGSAIGNKLEVMEAISIMKNDLNNPLWDKRALEEQKDLLIKMFKMMMLKIFPDLSPEKLTQQIDEVFEGQLVLKAFKNLLLAYKVNPDFAEQLIQDPGILLDKHFIKFSYFSSSAGTLKKIGLKKLGLLINFELNTGLNSFLPKSEQGAGVILKVRLGDKITPGQELCQIIADPDYLEKNQATINQLLKDVFVLSTAEKS